MKQTDPKIKAFIEVLHTGKLKSTKHIVVKLLDMSDGCTIHFMRELLAIPHQTLTSAISHLEDEGIIYKSGQKEEVQNNRSYSIYKYEPDPVKQHENKIKVKKTKFERWKNKGIEEYLDLMDPVLRRAINQTSLF